MKKPYLIAVITSFVVILILLAWIFNIKQDVKLEKLPVEIKSTKQKIDSISKDRNDQITDFATRLETDAKTSNKIIKSIQHEEIIIRDTTYIVMCKYIENYRPKP